MSSEDAPEERSPPTSLLEAIKSGDPHAVQSFASEVSSSRLTEALTEECSGDEADGEDEPRSPLPMLPVFHAADGGNTKVFLAVYEAMKNNLERETVVMMLTSARDSRGRNLLAVALHRGAMDVVDTIVDIVQGYSVAPEQAMMVAAVDSRGWSVLAFAVDSMRTDLVDDVVAIIERSVPLEEINPMIEACLPKAVSEILISSGQDELKESLGVLSCLLKHGTWPTGRQLSLVGSSAGFEAARTCLLDAVCLADNPLLVGMTLSLQLEDAAGLGNEGQRQVASRLQAEVEDLVSEVFERLPQTVDGFEEGGLVDDGMKACSLVFEPEKNYERNSPYEFHKHSEGGTRVAIGPLQIALQARPQMELFCTKPLVLDFLSRKFTHGLPGLQSTQRELKEANEVQRFTSSLNVQEETREDTCGVVEKLAPILAGTHASFGSLTILPGAQFILAQMAIRPAFCYAVPAIRMGMNLMVYFAMLCVFWSHVLMYEDGVGWAEIIFFIYVLGAVLIEFMELWGEGRDEYIKDHWNFLDVLALVFCGAGFIVRMSHPDSLWGRALYGAGTPLLLCRVLFFVQFLPAQGPMIEVIFSLAGELSRFGTIMIVVMMGFAMSFFALFRHSCTVSAFRTFSETWISLLRAMLGETMLFDDFSISVECCDDSIPASDEYHCEDFLMECCHRVNDEHFDGIVGKALLVAYLTLMGVVLLNLLIAVLSESYVDVKENLDTETKVSRTMVIQHYVEAVESDRLPSPLNLVQYVVSILAKGLGCCTRQNNYFRRAEFYSGLALSWLVSGLFAVSAGSVLWFLSWPKGISTLYGRRAKSEAVSLPVTTQVAVLMCGVSMPLSLLYTWLWSSGLGALLKSFLGAMSQDGGAYSEIRSECGHGSQLHKGIVAKALELGPGGLSVQQLREFLANPMNDPVVQRDEESRATTVEHVKLLRDRLESTLGGRVEELDSSTSARFEAVHADLSSIGQQMDERASALSDRVKAMDDKLSEVLDALK